MYNKTQAEAEAEAKRMASEGKEPNKRDGTDATDKKKHEEGNTEPGESHLPQPGELIKKENPHDGNMGKNNAGGTE
jgi:hypothetical protein